MKATLLAVLLLLPACSVLPLEPSSSFDFSVQVVGMRPGHSPGICIVSFKLSPVSGLGLTTWDFGDGTSTTLSALIYSEHGYPYPAGAFLVWVTATNTAGASGKAHVVVRLHTCSQN